MNEKFDNEEWIARLVREEGLLHTPNDFTNQVMQQIENEHAKDTASIAYKPLISKKMWLGIFLVTAILVIISFFTSTTVESGQLPFLVKMSDKLNETILSIQIPFADSNGMLMLITLAIASISLLLLLDYWVQHWLGKTA
jgi:hypothetical protein